jgi:toxin ParE1/3/4
VARVVITSLADADTAKILNDLNKQAGANVADRYDAGFDNLYQRLAQYPDSGAPRPKLGAYVRTSVVSPYVVIYEHLEDDDVVMIMRIVHGRRRITRHMLKRASSRS